MAYAACSSRGRRMAGSEEMSVQHTSALVASEGTAGWTRDGRARLRATMGRGRVG